MGSNLTHGLRAFIETIVQHHLTLLRETSEIEVENDRRRLTFMSLILRDTPTYGIQAKPTGVRGQFRWC